MLALFEKLAFALAGLTVVGVAAGVTVISLMPGGLRSGVLDEAVSSADATMTWLERERQRSGVVSAVAEKDYVAPPAPRTSRAAPGTPAAAEEAQRLKEIAKEIPKKYFGTDDVPPDEQVFEGVSWLRKVPGVRYKPPKTIPEITYRKYQSFQDTWEEVQGGGGEFVDTDAGTAYKINWLNEASMLYTKLGLRKDDKVIAVNGQPIGQSVEAGKAMFEQFKNERRFAVLIERKGQKVVLSFTVR